MRSAERSASKEHLERKVEKTEVRREALSVRDISRTLTRLFPPIRVLDIALQKKHLDVFRSILNSGVRHPMRLRHRSRESTLWTR